jgi:hypothetical protein
MGSEKGVTPKGVHVRNVALPVIKHAYTVYCLDETKTARTAPEAAHSAR